jgi:hypothetical protein
VLFARPRFAEHEYAIGDHLQDEFSVGPWNKPEAERKAQSIVAALRALDPPPEYVTILLGHDYTQANLLRPDILKGTDWVLHQAVAQAFPGGDADCHHTRLLDSPG